MEKNESKSDYAIPLYLYDGLCEYGRFCFCSFYDRSHSYSNVILRWSKKDLETYHMSHEDDATSTYYESLPSSPSVEKEPPSTIVEWLFGSPSKLNLSSSSNMKEDQLDLVVSPFFFRIPTKTFLI